MGLGQKYMTLRKTCTLNIVWDREHTRRNQLSVPAKPEPRKISLLTDTVMFYKMGLVGIEDKSFMEFTDIEIRIVYGRE